MTIYNDSANKNKRMVETSTPFGRMYTIEMPAQPKVAPSHTSTLTPTPTNERKFGYNNNWGKR